MNPLNSIPNVTLEVVRLQKFATNIHEYRVFYFIIDYLSKV